MSEDTKGWEYLVHWDGWNSKFDEWLSENDERMMKKTSETEAFVHADKVFISSKTHCNEVALQRRKDGKSKLKGMSRRDDSASRATSPTNMSSVGSVTGSGSSSFASTVS